MNKTTEALKLAEEALTMPCDRWNKVQTMKVNEALAAIRDSITTSLAAIREALAEPQITTPDVCGEVCARSKLCYGCGKAFDEVLAEPVKQEPVAWMVTSEGLDGTPKTYPITGRYKDARGACDFGDPVPLYAAPVQPVKQEPIGYVYGEVDGDYDRSVICDTKIDESYLPIYLVPADAKAIQGKQSERTGQWNISVQNAIKNERAKALEDAADAVRFADNGTEAAEIIRSMK